MFISHLTIRNFRALADIELDLSARVNVIVGPNAVGKTTILQAIRICKSLLAPRTQNEANQVLISLGAASPHFPQRLFIKGLARDLTQSVVIRCTYNLTIQELQAIKGAIPEIARNAVSAQLGQQFNNPANLIQFLQSPIGQQAYTQLQSQLNASTDLISTHRIVTLAMELNPVTGDIKSADPIGPQMIGFLDQRLPPTQTVFSYFPADRALPMGDVVLQVGGPDAQQQLESHNSQPQLKYQRLKNLIVNSIVVNEAERQAFFDDFAAIFQGILRGRKIKSVGANELGLLSVITEEIETGRLVDLDNLSSGEKNLALTFLLVAKSVANNGIALFDEPELHLNPAVSRDVLPFILNNYSKPRDIQFIMCTHSPEILTGAFADEECVLFHLKSSTDISKVGKRAQDEYSEALSRLGTSVTESLLSEGTILVEGDEDVAFLETAFLDIDKKFKLKARGGRKEVEKSINELQALEKSGEKVSPIFLIFDKDEEPTGLASSKAVRIMQWPKRCVENYMIDVDVITHLLKDPIVTRSPKGSEGEVHRLVKELAFQQLDEIAARAEYNSYGYVNASIHKDDVKGDTLDELAQSLFSRREQSIRSMPPVERSIWIQSFKNGVHQRKEALILIWEAKWKDLCDGKRLISDLHKAADLKMSEAVFKMRITQRMRDDKSDNWKIAKSLLDDLLNTSDRSV